MRYIYTIFLYLATPFILMGLIRRAWRDKTYIRHWNERFAHIPVLAHPHTIWLHAVSLGESIAATPLITALLTTYPQYTLVITTSTPTGSRHIIKTWGSRVVHVYMPYDFPLAIERFLSRIHPTHVIIMETELWPHVLYYLKKLKINTVIVNARLSTRSFHRYHRLRYFLRPFLSEVSIAAQSERDAEYFAALGIPKQHIQVTGNIKFDHTPSPLVIQAGHTLRQSWGRALRPTFIAASTHEGEEKIILEAFERILQQAPSTLLILVPRHPQRFTAVRELCCASGYKVSCRSQAEATSEDMQIYLGDTIGELLLLYAASDIAFVGGSVVPRGGHNLIEPASLGLPLLSGPYLDHFIAIRDALINANALIIVENATMLAQHVVALLAQEETRQAYGRRGLAVSQKERGAVERTMCLIDIPHPYTQG